MDSHRRNAIVVGVLFLIASVAAVLGFLLYGPILKNPDYVLKGPTDAHQLALGAFFELVTAGAVAGTSIALFPYLRRRSETRAVAYVAFRLLEAFLIVLGLVSMLSILTLRQQLVGGVALDAAALQVFARGLVAVHDWTFMLGPNFMLGINTLMYSAVLYQTALIPRPLATLGVVAALSVFAAALLELFGIIAQVSPWGAVLSLPVASFEICFAIYLIARGFRPAALAELTNRAYGQ